MNRKWFNALRLLVLVLSCMAALSIYSVAMAGKSDLFSKRSENAFDPATIDAIGDKVVEWQIANLDNLSDYMRN